MYQILIFPLLAAIIAQIAKLFIKSNLREFNLKNIFAYSGMPSSHAAMTVSLTAIIGLKQGFDSALFALSLIFTILVIRDALGLRRYLGQHGQVLNELVKDLKEDKMLDEQYPRLLEKIGHTPAQIVAGSIIGLAISLLGFYFF